MSAAVRTSDQEIRERIRERQRIPFAEFMELALYGENGYYSRPHLAIGEDGDFVTGSSFSPLFAATTARVLSRIASALGGSADYLEAGYGNGEHLRSVLESTSVGRRLAWDRVARPVPRGVVRLARLDDLPASELEGLVFSYELFDALPVHRLVGREQGPGELWVALDRDDRYLWQEGDLSDPALAELLGEVDLAVGQVADLSPLWAPTYRELAGRLGRGLMVTCDYGFPRRRLLDRRVRMNGTLACYSRQRVHRNPFVGVGSQDLTAHVDFTALQEAGEAAGLETICLTRQAFWLAATGVFEELAGADAATREQAMGLLDGEGMGEEIRVLVQAREVPLAGVFEAAFLGRGVA